MANITILNGPPTSGKTTWGRAWVSASPLTRKMVGSFKEAHEASKEGYDEIVIDAEYLTGHDVTVKKFYPIATLQATEYKEKV